MARDAVEFHFSQNPGPSAPVVMKVFSKMIIRIFFLLPVLKMAHEIGLQQPEQISRSLYPHLMCSKTFALKIRRW